MDESRLRPYGNIHRLRARARRVLGVPETADLTEVKRAFRELAHRCHPDRGGTHDRFIRIVNAYLILTDANPLGFPLEEPGEERRETPESPEAYFRWWKERFWP